MNHKNVERNIGSSPSEPRSEVSASSFAKIRRTYDRQSFGSGRKRKRKKRRNKRFRLYLSIVFVGVAAFFVMAGTKLIYARITEEPKVTTFDDIEAEEEQASVPHPDAAACLEMVKAVHEAKSADELQGFVVLRRLDAKQAFDLFTQWKKDAGEVAEADWRGSVENNGLSMEMVTVRYKTGKKAIVYIRLNDRNEWCVDLESMLQYCSEPMEKLLSKDDVSAVVRVLVATDFYYNGEFADSKEWMNISMMFPGDFEKLQGYVKLDSPSHLALKDVMRDRKAASVLLEISRSSSMLPKQYEIKSVLAKGWVESDVVFSDQFQKNAQADKK